MTMPARTMESVRIQTSSTSSEEPQKCFSRPRMRYRPKAAMKVARASGVAQREMMSRLGENMISELAPNRAMPSTWEDSQNQSNIASTKLLAAEMTTADFG